MGLKGMVGCRRRTVAVVAVAACAASVAACGGSSSHSSSSGAGGATGASSASTSAGTSVAAPANSTVSNALAQRYIGGKPGRASGKPVYIGFVNAQGGPVMSIPQATAAAQVAVRYVNAELGGVHGRPLALKTCFIATSEEEGQACGERFAADDSVHLVTYPLLDVGQQSLMAALQGKKPLISTAGVYTHPANAFILNGDVTDVTGGEIQYLLDSAKPKPKSVAVIVQGDSPSAVQGAAFIKKYLQQGGVSVRVATVQANAPNVASTLVSAGAQSADAIALSVVSPTLCIGLAEALPQLGLSHKLIVGSPACLIPQVAKAAGDLLKGTYFSQTDNALATGLDPDVELYNEVMKRYAPGVPADLLTAPDAFSVVLTAAKYLNATQSMTAAEISREVVRYHGPIFMAQPRTDCGFTSSNPSLCSRYSRAYTYQGHGKWTAGPWVAQSVIPWSSDK